MREEKKAELANRLVAALALFERDHDLGIMWQYDERKAGVVVGPNALAGFPFATGEHEALDRLEGIVMAMENAAAKSVQRAKELEE